MLFNNDNNGDEDMLDQSAYMTSEASNDSNSNMQAGMAAATGSD